MRYLAISDLMSEMLWLVRDIGLSVGSNEKAHSSIVILTPFFSSGVLTNSLYLDTHLPSWVSTTEGCIRRASSRLEGMVSRLLLIYLNKVTQSRNTVSSARAQ